MELINPLVLIIGIPILIAIVILFRIKNKDKYAGGKKVANTKYVKEIPLYKKLEKRYKIIMAVIESVIVLNVLLCLVLLARPCEVKTSTNKSNRKDIFLCMDVSTSCSALNLELIESLKDVVKKLDGERFGISIFNTTTILYVPLTDDYDYVAQKLDELKRPFELGRREYNNAFGNSSLKDLSFDERMELNRFYDGTILDADTRGSSLIGDGLATCMFSFPNMEEDRDRIIIFSTDNDLAGEPKVTLDEAAIMCKNKKITVYGIAPNAENLKHTTNANTKQQEFRNAVDKTGGRLYVQSNNLSVSSIVKEIQNRQKIAVVEKTETRKVDTPTAWVIALIVLNAIMFVLLIKF